MSHHIHGMHSIYKNKEINKIKEIILINILRAIITIHDLVHALHEENLYVKIYQTITVQGTIKRSRQFELPTLPNTIPHSH